MGNRAIVTSARCDTATYLHWNGDPDSIKSMCAYMQRCGYPSPEEDSSSMAAFARAWANFFDGQGGMRGLSVGMLSYEDGHDYDVDNGIYLIEDWKVADHLFAMAVDLEREGQAREELVDEIERAQPEGLRSSSARLANDIQRTLDSEHEPCAVIQALGSNISIVLRNDGTCPPPTDVEIQALLQYGHLQGFREPGPDCYGFARLAQVASNFWHAGNDVTVETNANLKADGIEATTYLLGQGFIGPSTPETDFTQDKLVDALVQIDSAQPEQIRLGEEVIRCKLSRKDAIKGRITNDLDRFFTKYFIDQLENGWMNGQTKLDDLSTEICQPFIQEPYQTAFGTRSDSEKLVQDWYVDQILDAEVLGFDAQGVDYDEQDFSQILSMTAYDKADRIVCASDTLYEHRWDGTLTEDIAQELTGELSRRLRASEEQII